MQVERIAEMALTCADDALIANLLADTFGPDFGGRSFHKQRHHMRLVVRDGDTLIGHIALCHRAVRNGNDLYDIVGLAEVATAARKRGQGIATRMLRDAIAVAHATTSDFCILFGDRPLYAGNGFTPAHNLLRFTVMDDAETQFIKTDTHDGLMVLPLGDKVWPAHGTVDLLGHTF